MIGNQKLTSSAVQKNIETIIKLEKEALQSLSIIEKMANRVTSIAGSSPFIILHMMWFSIWMVINTNVISGIAPFDPFPFSFLTLVVSLEAIFLTLLVLMSQNRMTKEADKRAHLDLQINILAEQESTIMLRMMQKLTIHLGLEEDIDGSATELSQPTDIHNVVKKINENSNDI